MKSFEKQQTIEAIKTVVKARWFFVTAAVVQVIVLRVLIQHLSFMTFPILIALAGITYGYNFFYWLYLRRAPERISITGLETVKVLQIVGDVILISLILYFDRTVTVFSSSFYLVTVMMASTLYKRRGIVLTALFIGLMYTGLAFLEYIGFFPPPRAELYLTLRNNPLLIQRSLIIFYCYLFGASIFAGYMAGLFRKREASLKLQRDELMEKTEDLVQTKNWLNESLIKSDAARMELTQTKEKLEKANLELREKIKELGKFYSVSVGREVKMVELKQRVKDLEKKLKETEGDKS